MQFCHLIFLFNHSVGTLQLGTHSYCAKTCVVIRNYALRS